jgi:hypothetical protein
VLRWSPTNRSMFRDVRTIHIFEFLYNFFFLSDFILRFIRFSELIIPLNAVVIEPDGLIFIWHSVIHLIEDFHELIIGGQVSRIHPLDTVDQRSLDDLERVVVHDGDSSETTDVVLNFAPCLTDYCCD